VTDLALLARLALGALIGFVVGAERERRGSRAGDLTVALVALGAAGFTAVGVENFPSTAEKVIAGVVTGVGFLGAGLIMKGNDGTVLGLTTAASIWATAAAGIYAGAGEPIMAVGMAAIVLLVLETPYLRSCAASTPTTGQPPVRSTMRRLSKSDDRFAGGDHVRLN